ncbi:hypothetical protein MD484_g4584, partial [Candolleomyces efflorescens]
MLNHSQGGLRLVPNDPLEPHDLAATLQMLSVATQLDSPNEAARDRAYRETMQAVKPAFPPFEVLPCANVQPDQRAACDKPGKLSCSGCKLVSYCSKECQKGHWKLHKQDCKDPLKNEDWLPSATHIFCDRWGNVPAMDVINLEANENDATMNLSIAFVASGDMRHVVKTINSLPANFSGELNVVLNDISLPIACRNLALLSILGTIPDEALAADVALHFWYSVFLPDAYRTQIGLCVVSALDKGHGKLGGLTLGRRSTVSWAYPQETNEYFMHWVPEGDPSQTPLSVVDAQVEYNRFKSAPARRDYRDRIYARLRPSHRAAVQEYRRFGIVLPFGAPNFHFNCANVSLFSLEGEWLQDDFADPLKGWDISDVIAAGKAHGAQPEDIYGCLYFYLSDQLRMFVSRIRTLPISFKLFPAEALHLANCIKSGVLTEIGLGPAMRFDRIQVSNIIDSQYIGIKAVLASWGPLLSDNCSATIVGYFLNWFISEKDGRPHTRKHVDDCIDRILEKDEKARKLRTEVSLEKKPMAQMAVALQFRTFSQTVQAYDAVYDSSKPFAAYLAKQSLSKILGKTKLRLKESHTIVSRRLRVPLQSPSDALPEFPDDESWYNYTKLNSYTWAERFVEFCRE